MRRRLWPRAWSAPVVEPDDLLPRALELAERVAAAPRVNLMRTKAKALARSGLVSGTGTLEL